MFTTESRIRRQELLTKLSQGTTDKKLFDELMSLNEMEAQSKAERKGLIDDLLKSMAALAVEFSEVESAFSNEQIADVAVARRIVKPTARGIRSRHTGVAASSSVGIDGARRGLSQKTGEVLISASSGYGFAATYNRGQPLPPFVPRTFKALFERAGDEFERELALKFTEAGKAYFATEEGQKELVAFIHFVKTGKRKPGLA